MHATQVGSQGTQIPQRVHSDGPGKGSRLLRRRGFDLGLGLRLKGLDLSAIYSGHKLVPHMML